MSTSQEPEPELDLSTLQRSVLNLDMSTLRQGLELNLSLVHIHGYSPPKFLLTLDVYNPSADQFKLDVYSTSSHCTIPLGIAFLITHLIFSNVSKSSNQVDLRMRSSLQCGSDLA